MIGLVLASALAAEVVVEDSVQAAIDAAEPGDVVVLERDFEGPVDLDKAVTLTSRGGILRGTEGRTLTISAPGAIVDHLRLDGSGDELTGPDACIYVTPEAVGARIESSHLTDCLFGIWIHTTRKVHVVGNRVEGRPVARPPSKGNGIHLFDAGELLIADNVVTDARDGIYVSATEHSVIRGNDVSHQRYGIHYMYSYDNEILDNVANHNGGGIALMESLRLQVVGNTASDNERQGILFRDVQYTRIEGNTVERNGEGLFFFSSLDNTIVANRLAHNHVGARIWAGSYRNEVHGNAFVANRQQVFYVAAEDQVWRGNYFSDHLSWDQDGDGAADRPYRADALTAGLLYQYPQAVFLLSSPSLELLRQLQGKVPALRVPTVVDEAPLVRTELR